MGRKIRVGIDVGGTFTKAVVMDNDTYEILGKAECLTTHDASEGVAKGVVEVFRKAIRDFNVNPDAVVFVAHSTTQATNALLEGDVAKVGIIGMGAGIAQGWRARKQTQIHDIPLAPGRILKTSHRFIDSNLIDDDLIKRTVNELLAEKARVIVVSEAFGVDDPTRENMVTALASSLGVPTEAAHEISKLYGLEVRTQTAVINASILPKMVETANMTEDSVKNAGIRAPLMIMRGDGGVMSTNEMRKRPILTLLSGPAASVAGALMYLKVSDGIFFEVGGTSTNIGVIRRGKPLIAYITLGGHRTFVNSLDVRVLGIAGGSMPRVKGKEIIDVGPRSAHIVGLPYSAFSVAEEIVDPELELFAPKAGDPNDYVRIKTGSGNRIAITNTCAANVLGMTREGDFAHGNRDAAKRAFLPLSKLLGLSVEETARRILEISSAKQIKVIEQLIEECKLEREHTILVGGGGGAAALIPFTAKIMGLKYRISDNAEVISSIGVALSMLRDMIERIVMNPTSEDLARIRREAIDSLMKMGADADTIDVTVEYEPERQKLKATALGAVEMRRRDLSAMQVPIEERRKTVAELLNLDPKNILNTASTEMLDVFTADVVEGSFLKSHKHPVVVCDGEGIVRLRLSNGVFLQTVAGRAEEDIKSFVTTNLKMTDAGLAMPLTYVLHGQRMIDLSQLMNVDQVWTLAREELVGLDPQRPIVIVMEK